MMSIIPDELWRANDFLNDLSFDRKERHTLRVD